MANGYSTNFQSLTDLLGSLGYDMSALTSPGSLYGFGEGTDYGTEYDMYFQPFDVAGFQEAQASLGELEQNLLTNVSRQFSQQSQDLRQRYGGSMDEIRNQSGQTGLVGGAAQRQRRTAARVGMSEQQGLIQQRESGMQSVQENIGAKLGQLEGTLLDFLGSQAQMSLNIRSFDPDPNDGNVETSGNGLLQPGAMGASLPDFSGGFQFSPDVLAQIQAQIEASMSGGSY
tara:strand:+ start:1212 stop:1898 length:687 start_codon:yes stop_codon:yes gene_type:complete